MKKLFFKPYIAIVILVLSIAGIVLGEIVPYYDFARNQGAFGYIHSFAKSPNGDYALIDSSVLYVTDADGNVEHLLYDSKGKIEYNDVCFDDEGNLIVLLIEKDKEGDIVGQHIKKYDSDCKFVCNIMSVYGENDAKYDTLRFKGGKFYVMAYNDDRTIEICSLGENSGTPTVERRIEAVQNARPLWVNIDDGCRIVVGYEDGSVYKADGLKTELKLVMEGNLDLYSNPDGFFAFTGVPYKDGIIVNDGIKGQNLDYLTASSKEHIYSVSDDEEIEVIGNMDKEILSIFYDRGTLAVSTTYGLDIVEGNDVCSMYGVNNIPLRYYAANVCSYALSYVGLLMFIVGSVLLGGALLKWRMSLLSRQLVVLLPIVCVMSIVLMFGFLRSYVKNYQKQQALAMMEFNEIAVNSFDVEECVANAGSEGIRNGVEKKICDTLDTLLNSNNSEWSKNIRSNVFLLNEDRTRGCNYTVDKNSLYPFTEVYYFGGDVNSWQELVADYSLALSDTTFVSSSESMTTTYITATTVLKDSKGNNVALLLTDMDLADFVEAENKVIKTTVFEILAFLAIIIAAICIVTYFTTGRLRKAENAIKEIASGNFDTRIGELGKDEVGEICNSVNSMAVKLEEHFEEKDRNEKFYYKFVPEKFKELLNKESFTDLRLGDAVSEELTVLFCDIRSFSLNSEMMTAKENFEFVNIIYGKAGPIIREHGGFVDKYIGDAVMALFENADDAVAAGIEIYNAIVIDPSTKEELKARSINIGIGIHSGMARIGIVGEDERLSGTVISNTVNLSSRLESLTKQYQTAMIISKETLDRMSNPDSLSIRYLGMIQVAGVNEVEALYEVLDCLDEKNRAIRTQNLREFRDAIREYHLGNIRNAYELMKKIREENKEDPVPYMYEKYIENKLSENDFEHNVFKFSRK